MSNVIASFPEGFVPPDVACFGKRYVKKWQAIVKTLRTYDYWRQLFWTAAISRFEWINLPAEIDPRFLEVMLCGWGCVAATKRADSPIAPYWLGRATPVSQYDIYQNPNAIDIIAPNGYRQRRHANYWVKKQANQYKCSTKVSPPDAALCWDNLTRFPTMQLLDLQAQRLANIDAVVDQHINAQRAPWVFACDEVGKKNAETMFQQIQSGQPAIYMFSSASAVVQGDVLQTGAAYNASDILNDELKIVSQVYTLLGIDNNASAEKRERVQTSETEANNEQFLIQRNSYLRPRLLFAERCNELFGWDCSVRWAVRHPMDDELRASSQTGNAPYSFEYPAGGDTVDASGGMGLEL